MNPPCDRPGCSDPATSTITVGIAYEDVCRRHANHAATEAATRRRQHLARTILDLRSPIEVPA